MFKIYRSRSIAYSLITIGLAFLVIMSLFGLIFSFVDLFLPLLWLIFGLTYLTKPLMEIRNEQFFVYGLIGLPVRVYTCQSLDKVSLDTGDRFRFKLRFLDEDGNHQTLSFFKFEVRCKDFKSLRKLFTSA